jgi:hypothetical protein
VSAGEEVNDHDDKGEKGKNGGNARGYTLPKRGKESIRGFRSKNMVR